VEGWKEDSVLYGMFDFGVEFYQEWQVQFDRFHGFRAGRITK
jgi:hypothetical protein